MFKNDVRSVMQQRQVTVAVCGACGATEDCGESGNKTAPPNWGTLAVRESATGATVTMEVYCPPCTSAVAKFRRG